MAKGQKRSNREPRKPKKAPAPSAPVVLVGRAVDVSTKRR